MPAASVISAGMASRLALSTDTLADELPMWRLSTVFSAVGMAAIFSRSLSISSGGNTRRHGPQSCCGHTIIVNSIGLADRHGKGNCTRRFGSTA